MSKNEQPNPFDEKTRTIEMIDQDGNTHEITLGKQLYASLTEDQISRVYKLQNALTEVYDITIAEWVRGFLSDVEPEIEIQIMEAIAKVYQAITKKWLCLSHEEKQTLYAVLCMMRYTSPENRKQALKKYWSKQRGRPTLHRIIKMYDIANRDIPPKDFSKMEKLIPGAKLGSISLDL